MSLSIGGEHLIARYSKKGQCLKSHSRQETKDDSAVASVIQENPN